MVLEKYFKRVEDTDPIKQVGRVERVQGILVQSKGPQAKVGEFCRIISSASGKSQQAEVVGVFEEQVQLMCYDSTQGLKVGDRVVASGEALAVSVGPDLLGRVIDSIGRPLDGKGPCYGEKTYPAYALPPTPMERIPIRRRMNTGIRAIDLFTPVGCGQRMGIFSGSGVGKSTLLGMIARHSSADVNVVALIGERGREVREFIENDLGEEGLKRSILVVSTSDTPALSRVRGAFTAMALAEYFRDQGKDVLLLFDSITRFAMSQREIGLAVGEPPTTRSYPPSVFSLMPQLLERSGVSAKGSITGLYTVLVEGDDLEEPVADAARGYLDGHLVLARRLAERHHYPALDVLASISRIAPRLMGKKTLATLAKLRRLLAVYREKEDLIDVGAYSKGSDPEVDEAIEKRQELDAFLQQEVNDYEEPASIFSRAHALAGVNDDKEAEDETVSIFA